MVTYYFQHDGHSTLKDATFKGSYPNFETAASEVCTQLGDLLLLSQTDDLPDNLLKSPITQLEAKKTHERF